MKILITFLLLLAYSVGSGQKHLPPKKNVLQEVPQSTFVLVSKQDMKLYVFDYEGKRIGYYPIACGKNTGNKTEIGDQRTPEGVFKVSQILDASEWRYGTPDGRLVKGVYGPWFVRLETPGYYGIGIHGTNAPGSISKRVSNGCVRMFNSDLKKLVEVIRKGTVVVIIPSAEDVQAGAKLKMPAPQNKKPEALPPPVVY